jgi:hypothetical protein
LVIDVKLASGVVRISVCDVSHKMGNIYAVALPKDQAPFALALKAECISESSGCLLSRL